MFQHLSTKFDIKLSKVDTNDCRLSSIVSCGGSVMYLGVA